MKVYIEENTKLRQEAKNYFEKDFGRIMNNSVSGKTVMNVRRYIDVKLIFEYKVPIFHSRILKN